MTVEAIDFYLILLFGVGFLHKWWVERSILLASERLTPREKRSPLGNAFRGKTRSLSWLMLCLGIVFLMRGIPGWEEPRSIVLALRLAAFAFFIWNQVWCYRMKRQLDRELDYITTHEENHRTEDTLHGIHLPHVARTRQSGLPSRHPQGVRQDHSS